MVSCSKVVQRGAIWQVEEVDALIALWGEQDIQTKLEGTTRNIKSVRNHFEQVERPWL